MIKANKKYIKHKQHNFYYCLMPGWLSWLERTAHRVTKRALTFFLGYREIAGSNPAPGIQSQES